ncbi:phosphatase PAP2 family protein [Rasiella rasia]|uniref:Phosphatase PAP2 family protein n=1 Tax=Rasiella rasia TaxID=2744027 RepID=A0A6G6GPD2_9FLAO|nr:phosphatase PAP2 family protein [Rasiella rasia]QIE60412.1 phosphatase PAP2 family protein [Rasiella rasia]
MNNIILLLVLFLFQISLGQQAQKDTITTTKTTKFKYEALVIPTALIGYGVLGLNSDRLQGWDKTINTQFSKQGKHKGMVDEYLQYTPALSVYALNAIGIEGKHRFKERTVILGTAAIIAGVPVSVLKNQRIVIRPNGKNAFSFPSGHTALAFLGAEFLHQEYKDVSVWYSISGYAVATATGIFRIYNNNHWFSDVVAGAGIGIFATKIAYWVYPLIEKTFFSEAEGNAGMVLPYYNGQEIGLTVSVIW